MKLLISSLSTISTLLASLTFLVLSSSAIGIAYAAEVPLNEKKEQIAENVAENLESQSNTETKIDGSLYVLNCSECHGFDGNSSSPAWPNLAGLHEKYIVKQLKDFKSGRRSHQEMKEVVSTIPSEKIYAALAEYFSEQKLKNPSISTKTNNDLVNLELGKEIFTGKRIEYGIPGCANCHGNKGLGDADGKYPRLVGQHRFYIINQMKLFRAKERTNDIPAMMQNISMLMDDEDIESVAAYIESLGSNK